MGHLPLDLQTATTGRSGKRYFVGMAHDFNSGIRLYCPTNKTTITRHSYKFIDTVNPNTPVYVISDPNVVFNTSLPVDSFSNDTSFAFPEEAGPTSLNLTASSTVEKAGPTLPEEVGPTLSSKIGPTHLQGANSPSDSSSFVSLSKINFIIH